MEWLLSQSLAYKTVQKFAPQVVAQAVGGYAGTLGHVADLIVLELARRGVDVHYERIGSKRRFVVAPSDAPVRSQ